MTDGKDWREANRANWDDRVRLHLGRGGYDLAPLRTGRDRLNAVEEGLTRWRRAGLLAADEPRDRKDGG